MKKESRFIIGNAIIWAALMLSTALLLATVDTGMSGIKNYLVTAIMVPLWFVSDQLVRRAVKTSEA